MGLLDKLGKVTGRTKKHIGTKTNNSDLYNKGEVQETKSDLKDGVDKVAGKLKNKLDGK